MKNTEICNKYKKKSLANLFNLKNYPKAEKIYKMGGLAKYKL